MTETVYFIMNILCVKKRNHEKVIREDSKHDWHLLISKAKTRDHIQCCQPTSCSNSGDIRGRAAAEGGGSGRGTPWERTFLKINKERMHSGQT